jgi:hypothetical protein
MKATAAFASLIAPDIERYLTLKRALGREYDGVRRVLAHVDLFVSTRGGDLTSDTFAGWCLTLQHLASGTRRGRMRVVRNFCLYRRRSEPASFLPDARLFPPRHQVVRPHLFKNEEVVRLLAIISELPAARTSPFRRENLRLAIALLYTTGLRLGELVRLTLTTTTHVSTLYSFANRSFTSRGSCRSRPTVFAKSIIIFTPAAPDRSPSRRRVRCFGTTLGVEPPTPAQDLLTRSGLSCAPRKFGPILGACREFMTFVIRLRSRPCYVGTARAPMSRPSCRCWRHTWVDRLDGVLLEVHRADRRIRQCAICPSLRRPRSHARQHGRSTMNAASPNSLAAPSVGFSPIISHGYVGPVRRPYRATVMRSSCCCGSLPHK